MTRWFLELQSMRFKDENEHPMAKQFVNDYFVNFFGVDNWDMKTRRAPFCRCFLKLIFVVMFEMDVRSSAREGSGCSHQPSWWRACQYCQCTCVVLSVVVVTSPDMHQSGGAQSTLLSWMRASLYHLDSDVRLRSKLEDFPYNPKIHVNHHQRFK